MDNRGSRRTDNYMLMEKEETIKILDKFAETVIAQARRNMTLQSIGSVNRTLYDSLERQVDEDNVEVSILGEDYWKFPNYGVTGIGFNTSDPNKKGWQHYKSVKGWRFRNSMPPPSAFMSDKLARTVSRSQAFATAKKVQMQGIKATEFISRPFESALKKLPNDLAVAYMIDSEKYIQKTIDDANV